MIILDNRGAVMDSLIIVGAEGLYVGMLADKEQDKSIPLLEALEGDESGISNIVPKMTYIPYADITRVKSNLKSEMMDIHYNKRKGKKTEPDSCNISCQDLDTTRTLLAHLKERLPGFDESEKQYGKVRASIKPSIFVAISALITWATVTIARAVAAGESAEITGSKRGAKKLFLWLAETLGPMGALALGGLITLLFVVWLVKRVKNPPLVYTLQS